MPAVGIVCDPEFQDGMAGHRAGDEYVGAIRDGAGALPLLIPVTRQPLPVGDILASVDGLLFPGAVSNVEPSRYGGEATGHHARSRPRRHQPAAAPRRHRGGKPVLCHLPRLSGIECGAGWHAASACPPHCPGGWTIARTPHAPLDVQYAPAHAVTIAPGGVLARLLDQRESDGQFPAPSGHRPACARPGC